MTEISRSVILPGRRLGRRQPSGAPALLLRQYLTGAVPEHPLAVDHLQYVTWGMDGNNRFGTCGPTSLDNLRRLVTKALLGAQRDATWEQVKALYVLQNPGFDEQTGAGDDGVDMQTMLADAVKHGFAGEPVLGFAKVDLGDPEEVRAAVAIFGGVLLGLDLQVAQQGQLGSGVWDYQRSPGWGGHAVVDGATEATGESGITWTQRVRMTPAFLRNQRSEAWVVILPAHLGDERFIAGMDMTTFAADYQQITGRQFPAANPVPPPDGGATFRLDLAPALVARLVAKAHRAGVSPEQWLYDRVARDLRR